MGDVNIKNKYEIIDDYVIIYSTKNGVVHSILVDLEDFDKVKKFSWHVRYAKCNDEFYAEATEYLGTINGKPKYQIIQMQKMILGVERKVKNIVVDHISHNTLDNRKNNLRTSSNTDNSKNRKGKNSNNTSGYRNVSWNKYYNKWVVQIQINKKNTIIGYYDDVHEAGRVAQEMREKYYGKFKGAS